MNRTPLLRFTHPIPSLLLLVAMVTGLAFLLDSDDSRTAHATAINQTSTTAHFLDAYCDGQTDCTAVIQRQIDSGQGAITFPKGVFRISKPLRIDLSEVGFTSLHGHGVATLVMTGPGPAVRFTGTHQGTAAPHTVKPQVWDRERTPLVDGLEIVGEHPEADGLEADGTMQLTLTRLTIRKCRHAIRLTGRNRNVIVSECHLYENSGIGLFLDQLNLHQINVTNCHISYNRQGGIVSRLSEIRNLQIGTCDIEGNMDEVGAPAAANIELDARDTSLGEVAIVGCTIQHSHNATNSANIRINGYSNTVRHTDERRHSNVTIADNVLSDVSVNIELKQLRGVTITGNTAWKGYERNIILEDCSHIVFASNVCERNPRYHYGDGSEAQLGVLLNRCSDVAFTGNVLYGEVGHRASLEVVDSQRINISGCNVQDYRDCGIRLENVSDSRVSDCIILSRSEDNICQVNCSNLQISNNLTETSDNQE